MKRIVFLSILFLLIPISRVHAAIVFSEVMYDPPGTDTPWVEVYNNGSQSVDLTKYYFYADGPSSTRHGITKKTPGSTLISPGGYAIIADDEVGFASAHPGLSVLDSSFSISSTNNSVLILTTDTTKPPATFDDEITTNPAIGAKNDGNSLQKNSAGIWIAAAPTPDASNNQTATVVADASDTLSASTTDTNTNVTADTDDSSSETTSIGPIAEGTPSPNIGSAAVFTYPQAHLFVPKYGTTGVAVNITTSLTGVENVRYGMQPFHVSFGDGTEESDFYAKSIAHTYKYPGTYVVYFEYSPDLYFDDQADILSDRKMIEITTSQVAVSSVHSDGSIELINNDSKEINISGWKISSLVDPNVSLEIPSGTYILAGKKITLATDQAGFSYKNIGSFVLSFPSGQVAAVYNAPTEEKINTVQSNIASAYTNNSVTLAVSSETTGVKIASAKNSKKTVSVKSKKFVADYSATLTEKDIASLTDPNAPQMLAANSLGEINATVGTESQMNYMLIIAVSVAGIALVSFFALKFAKPITFRNAADAEKVPQNIADDIRILDD